jgi:hypothetical protein
MHHKFTLDDAVSMTAHSMGEAGRECSTPRDIHPFRVMCRLEDPLEMITSLLYHLYADKKETLAGFSRKGVPKEVIRAIEILENSKDQNFRDNALRIAENPLAAAVKQADLEEHICENKNMKDPGIVSSSWNDRRMLELIRSAASKNDRHLPGFIQDPESRVYCHAGFLQCEEVEEKTGMGKPEGPDFPDDEVFG